jgi:hypothetical protein
MPIEGRLTWLPCVIAAGIRGMDMTIAMNSLQSSINIMLKGQAFVVRTCHIKAC